MTRYEREQTAGLSVSVEQVARLIHSFDRRQKARLLQSVPELRTIRLEEAGIPAGQEALLAHFDHKFDTLPERRPLHDDDPFLGGLTVAEFFALPEAEQARVWNQAHLEAERELEGYEQPVRDDALPAR
jgi:hypothetical protein